MENIDKKAIKEKNLIPFGLPGNEERDKQVRLKQKGSSSDKRKQAQLLSSLKRAKPETIEKKALQLATNRNASSLEMMRMIQVVSKRTDLTPGLQIQLIRALSDAHRTIYGTKAQVDSNITINEDEATKIIMEKIKNGKLSDWKPTRLNSES